jgi:nucleoside-triphosphatase
VRSRPEPGVSPPRVLVTGRPGSGKTTVIRRVIDLVAGVPMAGFYTEEIRSSGARTGFRVVTLDGRTARLASVGHGAGPRVGRYTVHLAEFEAIALPQLAPQPNIGLVVIDEIGKMECLSPAFVAAARRALMATVPLLGTVALVGGGFVAEARRAPGVAVVTVTPENRDQLPAELAARLRGEFRVT